VGAVWVAVFPFNLQDGLIGGIVVLWLVWLVVSILITGKFIDPSGGVVLRTVGSQVSYGDQVIELRRPFELRVECDAAMRHCRVDLRQGECDLSIILHETDADAVKAVFPQAALGISPLTNHTHVVSAKPMVATLWPHVARLLRAVRDHEACATFVTGRGKPPSIIVSLFFGALGLNLIAGLATLLACFDWMPKPATLFLSVLIAAIVWPLVWSKLGRLNWLAAWLCQGLCAIGIFFSSDYLSWEFADPIRASDLKEGGSFRVARPRRIRGLVVRSDWGRPWMKDDYGMKRWLYGTTPITGPDAEKDDPVSFWAMCEREVSVIEKNAVKIFLKELGQGCKGQWNGKVVYPVPWDDYATYHGFVTRGAAKVGLKRADAVRMVYLMPPSDAGWQRDLGISLRALVIVNLGWVGGALVLAFMLRRREQRATATPS